jgi:Family of unknown function (DUF6785)/Domain of unknown function (DUF6784)
MTLSNASASSTDATPRAAAATSRWRARALVIGLLAVAGMCFVGPYADMVGKSMQLGTLQFAPGAFGAFLVIVVLNRLCRLARRRPFLRPADLLIVYAMVLAGVFVSTRGVMEKLISPLVYLNYYANPANHYEQALMPYVHKNLVVFDPHGDLNQPAVRGYFEGIGARPIPWGAWLQPLATWGLVILAVVIVFLCMASLLRRQWVEHERLSFPLAEIPLHITDERRVSALLHSPLMWIGAAIPVAIFTLNGLHVLYPTVPSLPIAVYVNQFFPNRPLNGMLVTYMWFSFAAAGFAYFLASDLLLSLWLFFVITRIEDVIATALGYNIIDMPNYPTRLYIGYQAAAAYTVLAIYLGWASKRHLERLWRLARSGAAADEPDGMIGTRKAFLGLGAAFCVIVAWTVAAGMSLPLALAVWLIYFLIVALVLSRSVCEGGLMMCETSFKPIDVVGLVVSRKSLGAANMVPMAFLDSVFFRDMRGLFLAAFLDDQKLARGLKVQPRQLVVPILIAIAAAYIGGTLSQLHLNYRLGNITLYGYPTANAQWAFDDVMATLNGARPEGTGALPSFIMGGIVTALLVYLRTHLVWWPFHPLGYAMAPAYTMWVIWFPCFVTWVAKTMILRYGGMKGYLRVFWATFAAITRGPTPGFPWGG